MALIIDGYNLLHASGILPRGVGPGTLERVRGALLNFLVESLEADELAKAVVVFDAREAPAGRPRQVTHRGLRVHFAPNPGDADALIEQLILDDHSPRKLLVVSSDHRLQRAARRRRAIRSTATAGMPRWFSRRVGRQQRAADEPAKPTGPLSAGEVARWLSHFGMTPAQGSGAEQSTSDQAGANPNDRDATGSEPPEGNLANPFPPGYGEDLLEDS